ncbi:hypothetical protein WJX81_003188 [Elliptochloris bilobata]|uniref:Uncharacterized protein n=1 Tax=Elliptochloris bilobata TaxID=381761 RepID=A0AAW1RGN8_9CHLO
MAGPYSNPVPIAVTAAADRPALQIAAALRELMRTAELAATMAQAAEADGARDGGAAGAAVAAAVPLPDDANVAAAQAATLAFPPQVERVLLDFVGLAVPAADHAAAGRRVASIVRGLMQRGLQASFESGYRLGRQQAAAEAGLDKQLAIARREASMYRGSVQALLRSEPEDTKRHNPRISCARSILGGNSGGGTEVAWLPAAKRTPKRARVKADGASPRALAFL